MIRLELVQNFLAFSRSVARMCLIGRNEKHTLLTNLKGGGVMTNWDLEYDKNLENHRHNVAMESIDRDRLSETHRSNIANENLGTLNWRESNRHNEMMEQEMSRHNMAQERQAMDDLAWKKAAHGYDYALKKSELQLKQNQHNLDMKKFTWQTSMDLKKLENWDKEFKHRRTMDMNRAVNDSLMTTVKTLGSDVGKALLAMF